MQSVAIFGVGLIGGSFALALRRAGYQGEILGVSSSTTITTAVQLGVIDRGVSIQEAAEQADLVYLSQPIGEVIRTIEVLSGILNRGCLVTDAGSTKFQVCEAALRQPGIRWFLGGHPMAGKELRGVGAAEASLFEGRTYFFCPGDSAVLNHPVAQELLRFVQLFGANPVILPADEHDRLVSLTSHLPQLASTALASCLAKVLEVEKARDGAGPGLGDMTRLGQSSYQLWADILETNVKNIDQALGLYIQELQEIQTHLAQSNIASSFERAAIFSRFVRKPSR